MTLANLFIGFWAIIKTGQGSFTAACWLIFIAAILDTLDGAVARLVHSSSPFGAQIDSLSDITSFGVAPSFFIYRAVLEPFGMLGILLASFPLLFGAMRLARFHQVNIEETGGKFIGLPIPVSALLLVGFYLYIGVGRGAEGDLRVWLWLVPIVSLLMVSPIPYWKTSKLLPKMLQQPFTGLPLFIACVIGMFWNPALALFPIILIYTILGPVEWGIHHIKKFRNPEEDEDEESESVPTNRRKIRRR